jgi:ATP-binding cassette, subfamily C, bacterial LapB
MPRHMPPDFGGISFAGAGLVNELIVKHYDQTVGQFQRFVEVLADQQHRGATVARCHDLGMDLGHRDYAIAVARAQAIGQMLSSLTVLATLCVGIVLVLGGTIHSGGLVATMMLIRRITSPAQQAFSSVVRLRQVQSSVQQPGGTRTSTSRG